MFYRLPILGFILCASAAFAADEKDVLKSLQGEWKVEKFAANGEDAPAEIAGKLKFTFKDNQLIPSDNPKDFATIKLDPNAKPAQIDATDQSKETILGIYELDGATLKLCFAEGKDAKRPTKFESAKDSKHFYMILKRVGK